MHSSATVPARVGLVQFSSVDALCTDAQYSHTTAVYTCPFYTYCCNLGSRVCLARTGIDAGFAAETTIITDLI